MNCSLLPGVLARHLRMLYRIGAGMFAERSQLDEVNMLTSAASWAWPEALRDLFKPRGVNLLVAENPSDFVHIIARRRIHTTIVDMDSEQLNGLATVKIIRMDFPLLPCILLTTKASQDVLGKALQLDVFGVIDKPVDMAILHQLLNRIFLKRYNSSLFAT
jgi:DNA-binding NtrC family response regulator